MTLADVRDYIASLGLAEHVYMGKLPDKLEKSIGVYNSKHQRAYTTAIGGPDMEGYEVKYATLLVHWNKYPGETEEAATGLFEALRRTQNVRINDVTIKFILPLYDIQDVGTDNAGIYEMVIEVAIYTDKKER